MNTDGERDREGEAQAQFFGRHHGWSVEELYCAAVEEVENGNDALQPLVASGLDGVAGESANYAVAKAGQMADATAASQAGKFYDVTYVTGAQKLLSR